MVRYLSDVHLSQDSAYFLWIDLTIFVICLLDLRGLNLSATELHCSLPLSATFSSPSLALQCGWCIFGTKSGPAALSTASLTLSWGVDFCQ